MASKKAKALTTEANQKVELGKKRKLASPDHLDIFSYNNQLDLTFSYSTKSARTMPINVDSSDDEDEDEDADDGVEEFKRIVEDDEEDQDDTLDDSVNDSHEVHNIESDDESDANKSLNTSRKRSPSPPPPPPSQAELLRVQRQLKGKNNTREFEHAFYSLKEAVAADTTSPITPSVNRSTGVILLDDLDSPVLIRNQDRKVVVKVRTGSGIKKFNMKAGDKFEFVINELAKAQNVAVENILLSLNNVSIMPDDTPLTKGVTVADIIECVIMDSCAVVEEEDCIEIKVQGNTAQSRKTFQVSKNHPLENLFKEYSEFRQLPRSKLKFLFDGDSLMGSETPVELDMEDENVIDVREIS